MLRNPTPPAPCVFVFSAEESAALTNNSQEWSMGNGGVGDKRFILLKDSYIVGLTLHSDVAGAGVTTVSLTNNSVNVPGAVITLPANTEGGFIEFPTPFFFAAGSGLGFRTLVAGGASDSIISGWGEIRS